jgi:hypothetical protein
VTLVRRLLALSTFALAAAAFAQTSAPPAAAGAKVAPHTCEKPGEHPGRLASDNQRRNWVRNVNAYLECLKKYAVEHQSIAKPMIEQAQPHIDAANAAIDEHNKAATAFKADQEKNMN